MSDGQKVSQIFLVAYIIAVSLRGALKMVFRKKLGIWPHKGRGGLTEAQVFVEIF